MGLVQVGNRKRARPVSKRLAERSVGPGILNRARYRLIAEALG